jgi:hypothetical protein
MDSYKYEVSFSLCKQDIGFAKELVSKLNPDLEDKIFLYSNNQEELISQIGPEKFRDIFINQSRIVAILYRKDYGDSYYTQLEKDAVIERISKEKDGYNFIFMIPMIQGDVPKWYPSTRIYADPYNFSLDELAKFIEFKIIESEGIIKPIKFIDRIDNFKKGLNLKLQKIRSLDSPDSLDSVNIELEKLKQYFEELYNYVSRLGMPFTVSHNNNMDILYIGLGKYVLELRIEDNERFRLRNVSSLSFRLRISIYSEPEYRFINIGTNKPFIEQRFYRFNKEGQDIFGWSEEVNYGNIIEQSLTAYTYHDKMDNYYYDLHKFYSSENLVDTWYSLLFEYVKKGFELK